MQIAAPCGNGASDGPSNYPRYRVCDFDCDVSGWVECVGCGMSEKVNGIDMYYMRDNHTFRKLSDDLNEAIKEIESELDEGWTSGMLCSSCKSFINVHSDFRWPKEWFLSLCRDAITDFRKNNGLDL